MGFGLAVKYCEKCGETNKAGAMLCVHCGSSLQHVATVGEQNTDAELSFEMPDYHYESSSSNGGCLVAFLFGVSFLIPLVGLIVGSIFAASNDDLNKRTVGIY